MTVQVKRHTLQEFEALVDLLENADRLFEFIGGEIIEVPSNAYSSEVAARILTFIGMYLLQNKIGHVTGEHGGYVVGEDRYAPDVAYISKARQAELDRTGYNPIPPELAVEVVSPSDRENLMLQKVANYMAVGTVVWVVRPNVQEVEIYAPGQPVRLLTTSDILDGGDLLPGFTLAVKDIFDI